MAQYKITVDDELTEEHHAIGMLQQGRYGASSPREGNSQNQDLFQVL